MVKNKKRRWIKIILKYEVSKLEENSRSRSAKLRIIERIWLHDKKE